MSLAEVELKRKPTVSQLDNQGAVEKITAFETDRVQEWQFSRPGWKFKNVQRGGATASVDYDAQLVDMRTARKKGGFSWKHPGYHVWIHLGDLEAMLRTVLEVSAENKIQLLDQEITQSFWIARIHLTAFNDERSLNIRKQFPGCNSSGVFPLDPATCVYEPVIPRYPVYGETDVYGNVLCQHCRRFVLHSVHGMPTDQDRARHICYPQCTFLPYLIGDSADGTTLSYWPDWNAGMVSIVSEYLGPLYSRTLTSVPYKGSAGAEIVWTGLYCRYTLRGKMAILDLDLGCDPTNERDKRAFARIDCKLLGQIALADQEVRLQQVADLKTHASLSWFEQITNTDELLALSKNTKNLPWPRDKERLWVQPHSSLGDRRVLFCVELERYVYICREIEAIEKLVRVFVK